MEPLRITVKVNSFECPYVQLSKSGGVEESLPLDGYQEWDLKLALMHGMIDEAL